MESNQSEKVQDDDMDRPEICKTYENKRKRRSSFTESEDEIPKKKTPASTWTTPTAAEENNEVAGHQDGFLLEDFCDELLYEIFKYLDTRSLMSLMNISDRFQTFILDKRLWEDIDLSQEPLPLGILEDIMERSHAKTHSMKLRGPCPTQHLDGEIRQFNRTLRNTLTTRCTHLVTLEFYGVTLDFNQICINDFPITLTRLVLIKCNVRSDNKSVFSGIDIVLKDLEELAIEDNSWFDPYYVMPISKLPILRYLSLKGCRQLQEFIPYGSIASRYGFRELEVLDLRETPLNDSDLQCFNVVRSLKEIYLQYSEGEDDTTGNNTETIETEKPTTSSAALQTNGNVFKESTIENSNLSPSTSSNVTFKNIINDIESSPSSSSSSSSSSSQSPKSNNISDNSNLTSNPSTSTSASSASSSANNNGVGSSPNVIPLIGTNASPRSRFLPRPDHVIYLDVRNRRSPDTYYIRHIRLSQNRPSPPHEQLLRHNLFWDIMNPLGDGERLLGEENGAVELGANNTNFSSLRSQSRGSISDRGICCFGRTREPAQPNVVWIRCNNRPFENCFRRISVRGYKFVTDISLQHLVQCSPNLIFLDVSGTGVTLDGVQRFKELNPECEVVAEHLSFADLTVT